MQDVKLFRIENGNFIKVITEGYKNIADYFFETLAERDALSPEPNINKTCIVGETGKIYQYDGNEWIDLGTIIGRKGDKGDTGEQGIQGIQGEVGPIGPAGVDGVGVDNIELISTVGKVKTYRFTFTDTSTFDFIVTDGADGTGSGDVEEAPNDGATYGRKNEAWIQLQAGTPLPTYTITNDTTDRTLDLNNTTIEELGNVLATHIKDTQDGLVGAKGDKGDTGEQGIQGLTGQQGPAGVDGVGIDNIELISTVGKVKTYRITYTDTSTFDFIVTDGADGSGGVENETPSGTINGTNVNFSLTYTPIIGTEKLYLNGMRLKVTDDYTLSGNIITFSIAPLPGDLILADYIK